MLVAPPLVENVTCQQVVVSWLPWSPRRDVGTDTIDIAAYTSVNTRDVILACVAIYIGSQ